MSPFGHPNEPLPQERAEQLGRQFSILIHRGHFEQAHMLVDTAEHDYNYDERTVSLRASLGECGVRLLLTNVMEEAGIFTLEQLLEPDLFAKVRRGTGIGWSRADTTLLQVSKCEVLGMEQKEWAALVLTKRQALATEAGRTKDLNVRLAEKPEETFTEANQFYIWPNPTDKESWLLGCLSAAEFMMETAVPSSLLSLILPDAQLRALLSSGGPMPVSVTMTLKEKQ